MSPVVGGDAPRASASLGRFAPDTTDEPLVDVHLQGLPLLLLKASREHHDGLMRELRLLALTGELPVDRPPARLLELVGILGERYGRSRERRDAELDALIAAGRETVDHVDTVPAGAGSAASALAALMDEADDYCRSAMLMTVPRSPSLQRFGEWYIRQFVDQVQGLPPVRWDGPLRAEA